MVRVILRIREAEERKVSQKGDIRKLAVTVLARDVKSGAVGIVGLTCRQCVTSDERWLKSCFLHPVADSDHKRTTNTYAYTQRDKTMNMMQNVRGLPWACYRRYTSFRTTTTLVGVNIWARCVGRSSANLQKWWG